MKLRVNKLIDSFGPMECFGIWKKEGLFFSVMGKNIGDLINFSSGGSSLFLISWILYIERPFL